MGAKDQKSLLELLLKDIHIDSIAVSLFTNSEAVNRETAMLSIAT